MVVRIRLQRFGRRARPFYRVVVANAKAPRNGKFIELVGTYNPIPTSSGVKEVTFKVDRVRYWISVGAQPSDRVQWLLGQFGILPPKVVPVAQTMKHLPRKERKELKSFHTSAFSPSASVGGTTIPTAGADFLELVGPSDLSVPWGTAQLGGSLDLNRGATASSSLVTDAAEISEDNGLLAVGDAGLTEDTPHFLDLARLARLGADAQHESIHGQLPAECVGEDEGWEDDSRSPETRSGVLGVLASGVASLSSPLRSWHALVDYFAGGSASWTGSYGRGRTGASPE